MDQVGTRDSPLSSTSNIIGILTFIIAISAALYARLTYLRNSNDEYIRVKTSLSWYKTESKWLAELLESLRGEKQEMERKDFGYGEKVTNKKRKKKNRKNRKNGGGHGSGSGSGIISGDEIEGMGNSWDAKGDVWEGGKWGRGGFEAERYDDDDIFGGGGSFDWVASGNSSKMSGPPAYEAEMFDFVMDDLLNLEKRILEIVEEVDYRSSPTPSFERENHKAGISLFDGLRSFRFWGRGRLSDGVDDDAGGRWKEPSVAVNWIGVRTKCLELVRQREALTTRVQFLQMSLLSARLRDLEGRWESRAMKMDEGMRKLELEVRRLARRIPEEKS